MLLSLALAASVTSFDPLRFFAGETRGVATLKVILRASRPVSVRGSGRIDHDGVLTLDQIVTEGDKPPRPRHWRLRQIAPGRYEGTLTDARAGDRCGRGANAPAGVHQHRRFSGPTDADAATRRPHARQPAGSAAFRGQARGADRTDRQAVVTERGRGADGWRGRTIRSEQ